MAAAAEELSRVVMWRALPDGGSEYCSLWQSAAGFALRGSAIAVDGDRRPMLAEYDVRCDSLWRTQRVGISVRIGSELRMLEILLEPSGVWRCSGKLRGDLAQCADVDLEITPATNTLPVRRLGLKIGERRSVTAAWVRFPGLSVQPLTQTYTRLASHRYRYESETGFAADLEVDELGLVERYDGLWERVAGG